MLCTLAVLYFVCWGKGDNTFNILNTWSMEIISFALRFHTAHDIVLIYGIDKYYWKIKCGAIQRGLILFLFIFFTFPIYLMISSSNSRRLFPFFLRVSMKIFEKK